MHVLTKIFIVLVSLLAVAIVPLVAVHATNEGTFKSKWTEAELAKAAAANAYQASKSAAAATEASLTAANQQLQDLLSSAKKDADSKTSAMRKLESDLASAKSMQSQINSNLEIFSRTGQANQALTELLVREVRDLRAKVVDGERSNVELDAALSEVQSQLEVADAARKALQEEIQRLVEEKVATGTTVDQYRNLFGKLPMSIGAGATGDAGRVPADRDLAATIVNVQRSGDRALAEIDAGSRDGVKEGWTLLVGNNGTFVANLRIVSVDVNRATGVIEQESSSRGSVQVGQKAKATRGE
ncbi:MAG: hypothetical protein SGJ09_11435 [Phycisphaerae bacterium]|nr:hypothetical protein [Phycisphaerae bacterium]